MASFTLKHTLETSLDTYWGELFFSEEYNRRLNRDALGFRKYEVLEESVSADGARVRRVAVLPRDEPPAIVKKLVGDAPSTEEGRFDAVARRYTFTIRPPTLAEKIHISGSIRGEALGERTMQRVVEVEIKATIFGVGGVIEGFVEKTVRDGYDRGAVFTRAYIVEKGL